ncbi:MAG: tRNA (adenosine(37)-N6)-threonylcarbamoyltransferase complex ATPase subunit type 1 TsaE [Deltaproteobacteria bacterium]|nr:tRNA (adenosine(37)-N6)-threonylcarbamoyltransferase complex ATPase subunit type 1 TsaE [Deltaproteobacteria bacterium]
MRFPSRSAAESRRAASALGAAIDAVLADAGGPLVVALIGPLGAGKTEWVRGLAEGLGVDPALVASPTFVIASEYPGRRRLAHVDLYRIGSEAELEAAGFLDLLVPGTVVAVEWADRFPASLPADRIEVRITRPAQGGPEAREIELRATGEQAWKAIGRWTVEGRQASGASVQRGEAGRSS